MEPLGNPAVGITTLEFKVRVISSVGPDSPAVLVNFASEDYQMWFYLFPNKITMGDQGIGNTAACTMDTTRSRPLTLWTA